MIAFCHLKDSNTKVGSLQLLCGGFAGSTAALCTTPFDVVKTRVQLQALSPISKYDGVLHALKEIFRQEGFRGLYRCDIYHKHTMLLNLSYYSSLPEKILLKYANYQATCFLTGV